MTLAPAAAAVKAALDERCLQGWDIPTLGEISRLAKIAEGDPDEILTVTRRCWHGKRCRCRVPDQVFTANRRMHTVRNLRCDCGAIMLVKSVRTGY